MKKKVIHAYLRFSGELSKASKDVCIFTRKEARLRQYHPTRSSRIRLVKLMLLLDRCDSSNWVNVFVIDSGSSINVLRNISARKE